MKRFLKGCLQGVLIVSVLLFIGYYLARFTYHRGWWGRDSLIARSLWLCSGPPELEQSFYPKNVDVLVSACDNEAGSSPGFVYIFPDQNSLLFDPGNYRDHKWRLIDLFSGEEIILNVDTSKYGFRSWLGDDLVLLNSLEGVDSRYFLFKPSTQEFLLEIHHIKDTHQDLMQGEKTINIKTFVSALQEAEEVYVTRGPGVVLAKDYMQNTDKNFVFPREWLPLPIEEFLKEYEIKYSFIPKNDCSGEAILSPNKRLEARADGIYSLPEGEFLIPYDLGKNVPSRYYVPCGWLPDESAVVLRYIGGPEFYLYPPQPVLKFYLPEELVQ